MSGQVTDKASLEALVESLEQHEAERAFESLRSGNPFDAGIVEGISNAIDKLDSARTNFELQSVVKELTNVESEADNDLYAQGVAAGANHVAEIVLDELATAPDRDY